MASLCDLHTHSCYSDGTYTPVQLLEEAQKLGLRAIALCDHNTVAGLPSFLRAAGDLDVKAIPGIEFSTDYRGIELHLLGLFIEPAFFGQITQMMEDYQCRKDKSNRALVSALCAGGYRISYDAIKGKTPNGQVNRAHIGAALMEMGYVSSVREAFSKLLHPKHGFYTPPKRPDVFEMIRYIRSIGAVSVLAHPFLNLDTHALQFFLPLAVESGLVGMEIAYSEYDPETTALAKQLSAVFGLLPSGGSDFHGENKPDIGLGVGRGNLAVPTNWLDVLAEKAKVFRNF